MCIAGKCAHECRYGLRPEDSVRSHEADVTGGWGPPELGTGNQTRVLLTKESAPGLGIV